MSHETTFGLKKVSLSAKLDQLIDLTQYVKFIIFFS